MGRLKKDARQVKKAVTIFITDEELFRVKQMAQTWGTNVSQMVAHLINQTFESKAYLNGYDELTQDEREGLKVRRAHVNFLTSRRSEAARIRNFDRRNGLDRGLTNVMVIAAPQNLSGLEGKGFPGIFCKNLGDVWIVPYGLLERISVIEVMEFPCYASVFDYFAGKEIPKGELSEFIGSKREYVLSSFGEKAVLKRLFELYGHLRFPAVRQAKPIVREQMDELSNRITQYQRLMKKLRDVQAQKAINARILEHIQYVEKQKQGLTGDEEQPFDFEKSIADLKAIYEQGKANEIKTQDLIDEPIMTPQESLKALTSMMPEGSKIDKETLSRLQALAEASGEPSEEYFEQLKEQIDELYQGLDTFYDADGELEAYHMLDEAKDATTYYQSYLERAVYQRKALNRKLAKEKEAQESQGMLSVDDRAYHKLNDNNQALLDTKSSDNSRSKNIPNGQDYQNEHLDYKYDHNTDQHIKDNNCYTNEQNVDEAVAIYEFVSPYQKDKSQDQEDGETNHSDKDRLLRELKGLDLKGQIEIQPIPRKRGRPGKAKPKVTRIALPKYLASTAAAMASRVNEHVDMLKSQGAYPEPHSATNEGKAHPMPEVYGEEGDNTPFMPKQDFSDYNISVKTNSSGDFGMGALETIKAQDKKLAKSDSKDREQDSHSKSLDDK